MKSMRTIQWPAIAAAVVSTLIFLAIFGPGVANPHDLGWMQGDAISNQYGWHQYRNDPGRLFPVATNRASWPLSLPTTFLTGMPVADFLFKLLSPVLPAQFQYFGPMFVIGVALQGLLGSAILREATPGGRGAAYNLALVLGGVLFGTAPVMIQRFYMMHISLAMHWPVLLSILIYLRSFRVPGWKTIRDFSAVVILAALIMPYVMMMSVLVYGGYIVKVIFDRSPDRPKWIYILIPLECGVAALFALGYLGLGGPGVFAVGGFGLYSANFLTLIDPLSTHFGAGILPDLHVARFGQYEGFGYVGAGVLFLFIAGAIVAIASRRSPAREGASDLWPLFAVVLVAYLWALSNVMVFGSYVVEVPLPETLLNVLQNFRSSGRFIAVVIYVLMFMAIAVLLRRVRPERAALILTGAALLQIVDLAPPYAKLHRGFVERDQAKTYAERFTDPAYQGLGKNHDTLVFLPPWQCRGWFLPQPDYPAHEFVRFENLVMDSNLRSNSFYAGKIPVTQGFYHCSIFPKKLAAQPADKRTAYILTGRTFALFGANIATTHSCDFADGFFICRGDGPKPGLSDRARQQLQMGLPEGHGQPGGMPAGHETALRNIGPVASGRSL